MLILEVEIMAKVLADRLFKARTKGMTITLKLKFADFQSITRRITVGYAVSEIEEIKQLSVHLLDMVDLVKPVRLLGIGVSNFINNDNAILSQLSLDLLKADS
jgi:nucleotidyltransferase/DNA polymerase involved in DNA repair